MSVHTLGAAATLHCTSAATSTCELCLCWRTKHRGCVVTRLCCRLTMSRHADGAPADGDDVGKQVGAHEAALTALARCQMDFAKFLHARGERDAAIDRARTALELNAEASPKARTCNHS